MLSIAIATCILGGFFILLLTFFSITLRAEPVSPKVLSQIFPAVPADWMLVFGVAVPGESCADHRRPPLYSYMADTANTALEINNASSTTASHSS